LAFEIRFQMRLRTLDSNGPEYDGNFRLEIRDPKTGVLLWAFSERPQTAMVQVNRNKNFDQAELRIVSDVQALLLDTSRGCPQEALARASWRLGRVR
jgi:hypothetical protein